MGGTQMSLHILQRVIGSALKGEFLEIGNNSDCMEFPFLLGIENTGNMDGHSEE
jgi:hypothetical protein